MIDLTLTATSLNQCRQERRFRTPHPIKWCLMTRTRNFLFRPWSKWPPACTSESTKPNSVHTNRNRLPQSAVQSSLVAPLSRPTAAMPAMRGLWSCLERLAPTNISVLITGESGCGKGVAARQLRCRSSRVKEPFVAMACGSLGGNAGERLLFGEVVRSPESLTQARAHPVGPSPSSLFHELISCRALQKKSAEVAGPYSQGPTPPRTRRC